MKWCIWRCNLVIAVLGIEHGKPIVVFGGEYHVFHASGAGRGGPLLRVEIHRIKCILQALIRLLVLKIILGIRPATLTPRFVFRTNTPTLHNPPLRVGSPVHQQSKLHITPCRQFLLHQGIRGRIILLQMVFLGPHNTAYPKKNKKTPLFYFDPLLKFSYFT